MIAAKANWESKFLVNVIFINKLFILFVDHRISLILVCYLFQVHPIDITEITESTKSPNTNLSTPWTVESGTMCELDVFVGNYAIIDWEVYSLWLSGRSIAEAVTVFVKDNRALISDFHVSQDIIVSDFEDCQNLSSVQILKQNSN